jgi:hypothetical protein
LHITAGARRMIKLGLISDRLARLHCSAQISAFADAKLAQQRGDVHRHVFG